MRIITKLPRLKSIEIVHQQTGMKTIKSCVTKLARKLYFVSQISENFQIWQLGQYDPIFDTHKRQTALVVDRSVARGVFTHTHEAMHTTVTPTPGLGRMLLISAGYSSDGPPKDPVPRQCLRLFLL